MENWNLHRSELGLLLEGLGPFNYNGGEITMGNEVSST